MDAQVQELVTALDGIKNRVKEVVQKLGDAGVKWAPEVQETNSAAVLITHMFGSEARTVHSTIGGATVSRTRDQEFKEPVSTVKGLVEYIDQVGARTREVLDKEGAKGLERRIPGRQPGTTRSVREAVVGTLTHEAEHLGHLGLTEQLWTARKK